MKICQDLSKLLRWRQIPECSRQNYQMDLKSQVSIQARKSGFCFHPKPMYCLADPCLHAGDWLL